MKRFILMLFIVSLILFPKESSAEKTWKDHFRIWGNAGLTAVGIGTIVKYGKALVRVFKPETSLKWMEVCGTIVDGGRRIDDVQRKMQDPTGVGWLTWTATTAAEAGGTILEVLPPVRVGKALLNAGYEYYRNWQDDWMEDVKKKPKPPYRKKPIPPNIPKPKKPANDKPDDYMGVIDMRSPQVPEDDLQRLLQEYDELSLSYLAFEIGLSLDNPTCDYQMQKFITKLRIENPFYEQDLEEVSKLAEEAYQAAYKVQEKVCQYAGTDEFPHFKTQQEVTNFLNSLTTQQRQEVLNLQKIYFGRRLAG